MFATLPLLLVLPTLASPTAPADVIVRDVSVGKSNVCVITEKHEPRCDGKNMFGQLGWDPNEYAAGNGVPHLELKAVKDIAVGFHFICAIDLSSELGCWGGNQNTPVFGEYSGEGTRLSPVPLLKNAREVAAGWGHVCAIDNANDLYCWGTDYDGQVGAGEGWMDVLRPTKVLAKVRQVSAGDYGTCAVTLDGRVACWGSNHHGQRGVLAEDKEIVRTPTFVEAKTRYTQVSTGFAHTCAVTTGGALDCWGSDSTGQAGGMGTTHEPRRVMEGITQVATGWRHTCAVTASRELYCWGEGSLGRAGAGSRRKLAAKDAIAVFASHDRTCWIRSNGDVACPGDFLFADRPATHQESMEQLERELGHRFPPRSKVLNSKSPVLDRSNAALQ